jgi:hypothetical protein
MFRRSFTAANISKAVLIATAVSISACSGPGSRLVADPPCHPEAAASPDAAACLQVPHAVRWDPSESGIPRQGVYYDP